MRFIMLLGLGLSLAGCATFPPPSSSNAGTDDPAFFRLAEAYIDGYLAWRPQVGTGLGLHDYDGKITDFGARSLATELRRLKTFDKRLSALDPTRLSTQAHHEYRILRGSIQREIFSFEALRVYWRNPMTYAGALDVSVYIKRNFAPIQDRLHCLTRILEEAPRVFTAARANLDAALPRPEIETAIDQAEGVAAFLSKDVTEAVKDVNDTVLMARFQQANRRAIEELRGFALFLKTVKLPCGDDRYALGRENYCRLLRCGEMITQSPEQLLELGFRELRRQQQAFAEAAAEIDPTRKPIEVFQAIQQEHPTELTLIPDTTKNLEQIRRFVLTHQLLTIPSPVRARVAETPPFLRATSFASMDTPGPFETKATEAYYYVTPTEPDWSAQQKEEWLTAFNYYTTDIVSTHEVYPGHYVQFLCLNASPASRLEKIFTSYAFTEGWAHYAEQMMLDEGFGREGLADPGRPGRSAKYRLAQADEALLRVCRLCVSIQMHCQGMNVENATRFFQDNCYYEAKPARQEAVRGTFDPEYLYYAFGKLQILKLRDDYRKQEGPRFSLQTFHDELLRHGAPPIRLLREIMLRDPAAWAEVL